VEELDPQTLENLTQLKGCDPRHDLPGVELADLKKRTEQVLHDRHRNIHGMEEIPAVVLVHFGHAVVDEDAERRERLAQVVVGCTQEAGFGLAGCLGILLGAPEGELHAFAVCDVVNGDRHSAARRGGLHNLERAAVRHGLLDVLLPSEGGASFRYPPFRSNGKHELA
jgi:hypothetical protein